MLLPKLTSLTGGGGLSAPSSASADSGDIAADLFVDASNAGVNFAAVSMPPWVIAAAAAAIVWLLVRR